MRELLSRWRRHTWVMILSDVDIRQRMEKGEIVIDPLDDPDLQIQPASVDLKLGEEFLEFRRTNVPCIHPNSENEVTTVGIPAGPLSVGPIRAAPMSATAEGKNDWSISLVKTPGDIIFSAIWFLLFNLF